MLASNLRMEKNQPEEEESKAGVGEQDRRWVGKRLRRKERRRKEEVKAIWINRVSPLKELS